MSKKKTTPTTPEQSFRRSEMHEFLGQKLEPFSFLRQSALIAIELKLGLTYADEIAAAIWIMTQPDNVVKQIRQNPDRYIDALDKFADENGLGAIAGRNFALAKSIFEQIREDIQKASGRPDFGERDGGQAGESEEEDEPGN
jgi:hypothetical protein